MNEHDEMTLKEALFQGLVLRVHPKWTCGSQSPESKTDCRLEPGHLGPHHGFDPPPTGVSWT